MDSKWRGVVRFREVTDILLGVGYDGWLVDDFDFTGYSAYDSAKACNPHIVAIIPMTII